MPENWQGMRDDVSQRSDQGLLISQNTSYNTQGEIGLRPGLGARLDNAGQLVQEFKQPVNGSYALFFTTSGTLVAVDMATLTAVTVKSGLDTDYAGCMTKSQGRAYFVNDFDKMQVVERGDAACTDAGITGPVNTHPAAVSTASGNGTTGDHRVRYRGRNSKSGYVSNPSGELTLTVVSSTNGSNTFDIGTASSLITRLTDSKVDQLMVEMTTVNGDDFYLAATVANSVTTSVTVNVADASLSQLTNVTAFYGDFGHEPPPLGAIICEHRGRLFEWGSTERVKTGVTVASSSATVNGTGFSPQWTGRQMQRSGDTRIYSIQAASSSQFTLSETYAGTGSGAATITVFSNSPDTLYWSRPGWPESWKPLEQARRILQNEADQPAGMISQNDVLCLWGQRSLRKLIYTADPATGKLVHVPTDMGVWNQQCLVEADGLIYGFGRSGIFAFDGSGANMISLPVQETIDNGNDFAVINALDPAQFTEFHGVYSTQERTVTFFYTQTGDTKPKNAVTYYVDDGQWRIDRFRQGIVSSTMAAGSTNRVRALVCDENGKSWFLTQRRFDGVPTTLIDSGSNYTGVVVCASGSTTTVLQIASPSLPTGTGVDLAGVILTDSTGANERVVTSNTASTITIPALSGAPSAGAEFYLGSISWKMRTKWWVGEGLENKKDPSYLCISFIPTASSGKLIARVYADYATNPSAFTDTGDTKPNGVAWTDGATFATIDLDGGGGDGFVCIPVPVRWSRALSAQLESIKPLGEIRVLDVYFSPVSRRQSVREDKD